VKERYGISHGNRHFLLLDGHESQMMLEVVQKARVEGLDIITLPSHTSYRLQPLDVTIFKSFKVAFKAHRDKWTLDNKGKGAKKENLTKWVSLGLKKTLIAEKIQKGFATTGIWPLDPTTINECVKPSKCYIELLDKDQMECIYETAEEQVECILET